MMSYNSLILLCPDNLLKRSNRREWLVVAIRTVAADNRCTLSRDAVNSIYASFLQVHVAVAPRGTFSKVVIFNISILDSKHSHILLSNFGVDSFIASGLSK